MKKVLGLSVVLVVAQVAHAADIDAGKEMAATLCAACHGANGVSVSDTIPNLAAQRTGYLEAQLKAFKDGTRKQPGATSPTAIMNAIATQLTPTISPTSRRTLPRSPVLRRAPSRRCCRTLRTPK